MDGLTGVLLFLYPPPQLWRDQKTNRHFMTLFLNSTKLEGEGVAAAGDWGLTNTPIVVEYVKRNWTEDKNAMFQCFVRIKKPPKN